MQNAQTTAAIMAIFLAKTIATEDILNYKIVLDIFYSNYLDFKGLPNECSGKFKL